MLCVHLAGHLPRVQVFSPAIQRSSLCLRSAARPAAAPPMAASVHTTCTDSTYDAALKELLTQKAPHFALFSASLGPDGAPWCPDCKQALPVVVAAVAGAAGALLEVQLDRPVWKDKEHPHRFRGAPLNLTGIPTLLFFKPDGTEGARLGEALESADSSEAAAKVVAQFIAETTSA